MNGQSKKHIHNSPDALLPWEWLWWGCLASWSSWSPPSRLTEGGWMRMSKWESNEERWESGMIVIVHCQIFVFFWMPSLTQWLWEWSRGAGRLEEEIWRRRSWCRARWRPRSTPATSSSGSSLLPCCPGAVAQWHLKHGKSWRLLMRLFVQKCQFGPSHPPHVKWLTSVNQRVTLEPCEPQRLLNLFEIWIWWDSLFTSCHTTNKYAAGFLKIFSVFSFGVKWHEMSNDM